MGRPAAQAARPIDHFAEALQETPWIGAKAALHGEGAASGVAARHQPHLDNQGWWFQAVLDLYSRRILRHATFERIDRAR